MRLQLLRRDDGVDQSRRQRPRGVQPLAQAQHLKRDRMPGALGQQQARRGFGHHAEIKERHRQPRRGAGIDQIAMQQHGRADADGGSVDGGNQRLLRMDQRVQKLSHRRIGGIEPGLRQKILEVVARAEYAAGPRKHMHANARIRFARRNALRQRRVHALRDCILLGGAVEAQHLRAAMPLDEDVSHRLAPTGTHCAYSAWRRTLSRLEMKPNMNTCAPFPVASGFYALNTAPLAAGSEAAPSITVRARPPADGAKVSAKNRASANCRAPASPPAPLRAASNAPRPR